MWKCVAKMAPRPHTGHLRISALRMRTDAGGSEVEGGVAMDDILSRALT
jgi:hypothetical protein